jgi:hypothetical protein
MNALVAVRPSGAYLALEHGGLADQRQTQVAALVGDGIDLIIQKSHKNLRQIS